jgi:Zn-dependent peptidase ImmA (M78 family)/transcriptional regulator with XRE-family HTH domain
MPQINPRVLVWARETAGLSLEAATKKLGLSGPDRLLALETGEREPSRAQLAKMAEKYHRPLLAFYLPEPPRKNEQVRDFRSLRAGEGRQASETFLDILIRDVQARQQLVRAALEELDEATALDYVNSARMRDGVEPLVESMRDVLGVGREQFRAQKSVGDAFATLRAGAEKAGIFVLLLGNLGTHHSDIDVSVFRGFAIADQIAPFIVINEKDSRAAWSFTLLHELAHIWLGQSGISGYGSEDEVERFCDLVAAAFLLDPQELQQIDAVRQPVNFQRLVDEIGAFASARNLSRKMVAYNLLRIDLITARMYQELAAQFDADRRAQKEEAKGEGGPDYYVVRRHRVGHALVSLVGRMVDAGALSTPKAGKVLGVKATAVDRIIGHDRAA